MYTMMSHDIIDFNLEEEHPLYTGKIVPSVGKHPKGV